MNTARKKLTGQKKRIIYLLDARGPRGVFNWEFPAIIKSLRFGARIKELRDQGFIIQHQRVKGSTYRYTLENPPITKKSNREAKQLVML